MKNLPDRYLGMLLIVLLVLIFLFIDKSTLLPGRLFAESIEKKADRGKDINILLMGIDARPGETTARSDTMILLSIHPSIQKAVLIWIPRDTRLNSRFKGSYKINSVNFDKGPLKACEVVGELLDVDVEYYISVNFKGFEKIIDQLGGLDVNVDINLDSYSSNVHLSKGRQHLSGKEALKYARFRSTPQADLGRMERQQNLMNALIKRLSQPSIMLKIPILLPQLKENTATNISVKDLVFLSQMEYLLNADNVYFQTLPGRDYIDPYSGASYWIIDQQIAASVIKSVLNGHRYEIQGRK